ncbi:MAG TPA: glycosyltransferase family 4 protein [Polyangiales bacterium]
MSRVSSQPRVLHMAALPFPTYQGTQGAIRHMLEASTRASRDAQLFTYASAGYARDFDFAVHRTGAFPHASSLRSGPSLAKLALDLRMAVELRWLCKRLSPDVIVAHHVEAAALALALGTAPVVFFAHTDLAAELPVYGPRLLQRPLARAGRALDRQLSARAPAVAVISKTLLAHFSARASAPRRRAFYVPTPWPVRPPSTLAARQHARAQLDLRSTAQVALYAGNLDAYQGIDTLVHAFARCAARAPALHLLVATQSDPHALVQRCMQLGVLGRLRLTGLRGAPARTLAHAAADFAVVPRLAPGGLPIKLLDALSRGVACATMPHACAGLSLREHVELAADESPEALAQAIARLSEDSVRRADLAERGRDYLAAEHTDEHFLRALDAAIGAARERVTAS